MGVVKTIQDFQPDQRLDPRRAPWPTLELKDKGKTDQATRIWSKHLLLDLTTFEALEMKQLERLGDDYLFIEMGGFSTRHPVDWKSTWVVLQRQ